MQSKLDNELAVKDLSEKEQQYINELYVLRMDITKRVEEIGKKTAQNAHLSEELQNALRKVADLVKRDNEIASMQNDIEAFINFFASIDKHMRTLVKFLKEFISKSDDPKHIEHNQKQIKSIESLLEEVKAHVISKDTTDQNASKLMESFFSVNNDSLRDVANQSGILNSTTEIDHQGNISIGMDAPSKQQ